MQLGNCCRMIRISPDGKKLACTYISLDGTKKSVVEYCNFNSSDGVITPLFTISLADTLSFGNIPNSVEFSRDSRYMYVSSSVGNYSPSLYYQFDATLTDSSLFKQSEVFWDQ